MTLRTPNPFNTYQSMLDLQRVKERYAQLQEQLTTGKRIARLGDDPTGAALVIDFKSSVHRNEQFVRMIGTARNRLQASETALGSVDSSLVRLLELAEQGVNGTTGAAGRAMLSNEVDGIRSNLIAISNTAVEGKFLFAGTRTQTQPFSGPPAGPVLYAGDANSIQVDVSIGVPITVNLTGSQVFYGTGGQGSSTDVFQAVTDLRDGLVNNNVAQIQTAYANLKGIQDHFSEMATLIGGRQASLDQLESNLEEFTLSLKAIQGSYEDLDYPAAITEFVKLENVQQASLSTLGRMSRQSLFDYLS